MSAPGWFWFCYRDASPRAVTTLHALLIRVASAIVLRGLHLYAVHGKPLCSATSKVAAWVLQIKERIRSQAAVDVDPPLAAAAQYMRQEMTREGYRHLLAVGARASCIS